MNPTPTPKPTAAEALLANRLGYSHPSDRFLQFIRAHVATELAAKDKAYLELRERFDAALVKFGQDLLAAGRERDAALSRERVTFEALQSLRDEQNGIPLFTREKQYLAALDKADKALATAPNEATGEDTVQLSAVYTYFLKRLSEENCMGTIVDVFTSIREDLENVKTFRAAIDTAMKAHGHTVEEAR